MHSQPTRGSDGNTGTGHHHFAEEEDSLKGAPNSISFADGHLDTSCLHHSRPPQRRGPGTRIGVTTETFYPWRSGQSTHHLVPVEPITEETTALLEKEDEKLLEGENNIRKREYGSVDPSYRSYPRHRTRSKSASKWYNPVSWRKDTKIWLLTVISLLSNMVLFSCKIYISITSHSLSVLASAVDSLLDLISQLIIYCALRGSQYIDEEKWPVGKSRLELVGIILCASLMGIASLQLVYESIQRIVLGSLDVKEQTVPLMEEEAVTLLVSAICIKAALFLICSTMRHESDSVMVLVEDHRNDVLSNSVALLGAYLSYRYPVVWWIDAAGAILISVYICFVWSLVAREQAAMLVGRSAEPEFLGHVTELANNHHEVMFVDIVRAYHFGKRYLVELEVVLPKDMNVMEAHDIALSLQKRVERLREVERAFVHVDYMERDENEHKVAGLQTPPESPLMSSPSLIPNAISTIQEEPIKPV